MLRIRWQRLPAQFQLVSLKILSLCLALLYLFLFLNSRRLLSKHRDSGSRENYFKTPPIFNLKISFFYTMSHSPSTRPFSVAYHFKKIISCLALKQHFLFRSLLSCVHRFSFSETRCLLVEYCFCNRICQWGCCLWWNGFWRDRLDSPPLFCGLC